MDNADDSHLKDNVLYHTTDDGQANGAHYSSVIRRSDVIDESKHSEPQNDSAQTQGAPVYAAVDKNRDKARSQSKPPGPPVATKPSRDSNTSNQANPNMPIYAMPDKPKKDSSKSPPHPVRTANQDGLLYSEVEHNVPIPPLPGRKSNTATEEGVTYADIRTELW